MRTRLITHLRLARCDTRTGTGPGLGPADPIPSSTDQSSVSTINVKRRSNSPSAPLRCVVYIEIAFKAVGKQRVGVVGKQNICAMSNATFKSHLQKCQRSQQATHL